MDLQTASYIVKYYSIVLNTKEKVTLKQAHFIFKSGNTSKLNGWEKRYKNAGWLSEDRTMMDLIQEGYDNFKTKVATKIISQFKDKVFLNYCPDCKQLARTPEARQCRHCGFDWHDK